MGMKVTVIRASPRTTLRVLGSGIGVCYDESCIQKLTLTHSFMSFLFTDPRWREQNQKLLQNLSKRATILETSVQQNSLPSAQEALVVFNS